MSRTVTIIGVLVAAGLTADAAQTPAVSSIDRLELRGVRAETVTHDGRPALRLLEVDDKRRGGLAVLRGVSFTDGTLEVDVAGRRGPHALPADRGFIGLAFRTRARFAERDVGRLFRAASRQS